MEQQRDILDYTYKMLTKFCNGKPPRGTVLRMSIRFTTSTDLPRLLPGGKSQKKQRHYSSNMAFNMIILCLIMSTFDQTMPLYTRGLKTED